MSNPTDATAEPFSTDTVDSILAETVAKQAVQPKDTAKPSKAKRAAKAKAAAKQAVSPDDVPGALTSDGVDPNSPSPDQSTNKADSQGGTPGATNLDQDTGEQLALDAGLKFNAGHYEFLQRAATAWAEAKALAGEDGIVRISPFFVAILGLDVPENSAVDPLYDRERANYPIDDQWIDLFVTFGWLPDEVASVVERSYPGVEGLVPVVKNGRQRTKHARQATIKLMEANAEPILGEYRVVDNSDERTTAVGVAALNAYRLDDSTLVKARRAARLLEQLGGNFAAVALAMRLKNDQQVRNYVGLASCPQALHDAIDQGKITLTSAVPLLRKELSDSDRVTIMKEAIDRGFTSVNDVRGLVKVHLGEVDPDAQAPKGKGGKGRKGVNKGWISGSPPKRRFLKAIMERMLAQESNQPFTAEEQAVFRALRFVVEGDAPPKLLAGHVRAVNNE